MTTHVLDHALAAHRIAELRSTSTGSERFRRLVGEVAGMLAFEATRDLATEPVEVQTPLGRAAGRRLVGPSLVVPILRAGLGMLEATIAMVPTATVALLGMRRDETTLLPDLYCDTVPADLTGATVLVLDPMLATGGSLALAIAHVEQRGAARVHALSLLAAPEGLAKVEAEHPAADVWVAAVDRRLNDVGYIDPGLGDAGDRLYGHLPD